MSDENERLKLPRVIRRDTKYFGSDQFLSGGHFESILIFPFSHVLDHTEYGGQIYPMDCVEAP